MKPKNKNKAQELLGRLNTLKNSGFPNVKTLSGDIINQQYSKITDEVKNSSTVKMLDALDSKLNQFKVDFDPALFHQAIEEVSGNLSQAQKDIQDKFDTASTDNEMNLSLLQQTLETAQTELKSSSEKSNQDTLTKITTLQKSIQELSDRKIEIPDFTSQIADTEKRLKKAISALKTEVQGSDKSAGFQAQITELQDVIQKFRKEFMAMIGNVGGNVGGGSMNRHINFNGTDFLTKYTDINYKSGSNVTFTIANNNATKMVDVTIAATGGSGSGIVRSVNSISGDTMAGASATTDYVYLCTGTLNLTLPDATTNSNLYTIKNVGNGIITISTTSSQTIDGSLTITLPVQYTSVDVTSDTANWNVT